ncbi:hypothetical protein EGW08_016866 [Elysia chlorotica]|uniref:Uncharacterized protein n=1 Tax=Elysia chlorotica TaxID=188477 RepID=A0A3S1B5D4_ELYCH|nr:hypothetical protein EGW08_016866 [Elysia chlorotica]
MALSCALKPEFTDGCQAPVLLKFQSEKAFFHALCTTHRFAYQSGVTCFGQTEVQDGLSACVAALKSKQRRRPCQSNAFTDTRQCFRDPVRGASVSGCTREDFNLLGVLADASLRAYSDLYGCDWADIAIGPIATPTTTMAETTTVSTTTATTTMMASTAANTTEAARAPLGGSADAENVGKVKDASAKPAATSALLIGSVALLALLV